MQGTENDVSGGAATLLNDIRQIFPVLGVIVQCLGLPEGLPTLEPSLGKPKPLSWRHLAAEVNPDVLATAHRRSGYGTQETINLDRGSSAYWGETDAFTPRAVTSSHIPPTVLIARTRDGCTEGVRAIQIVKPGSHRVAAVG
jgi:hypothetical protein